MIKDIFEEIIHTKSDKFSRKTRRLLMGANASGVLNSIGYINSLETLWCNNITDIIDNVVKRLEADKLTQYIKKNDKIFIEQLDLLINQANDNIKKQQLQNL